MTESTTFELKRLLLPAILLVTLLVYANSLQNGYVWDDRYQLRDNQKNLRLSNIPTLFTTDVGRSSTPQYPANVYRPLVMTSYAIDQTLGGHRASVYHSMNLVWHLLAITLFYLFVFRLVSDHLVAFTAAALFALHPGQNEAVAWLAGRHDLMPAAFAFAALLGNTIRGRPIWRVILIPVFVLSALLSKESAIVLPLLIGLFDLAIYRNELSWRWTGSKYIGVAIALVAYFSLRQLSGSGTPMGFFNESLLVHGHNYLSILCTLGYAWVYPLVTNPCRIYHQLPGWAAISACLLVLMTVGFSLVGLARSTSLRLKLVLVGIGWFMLTIVPLTLAVPVTWLIGERYLYFPSAGIALALGLGFRWLVARTSGNFSERSARWLSGGLLGVVLFTYGSVVIQRNPDWKNDRTLFESVEGQDPFNPVASAHMGRYVLTVKKNPEGAMFWFLRVFEAAKIPPYTRSRTLNYMTNATLQLGWFEQAVKYGRKALANNRGSVANHFNLGLACMLLSRRDKKNRTRLLGQAESMFRRTLQLYPRHYKARGYLGMTLFYQKRYADAEAALRPLLAIRPEIPGVRNSYRLIRKRLKR